MDEESQRFSNYYNRLNRISRRGLVYKRFIVSPILFLLSRQFGPRIMEIGVGLGSGLIGAFPSRVCGLDINPLMVDACRAKGLQVDAISADGIYPAQTGYHDVCVLDNVLEHIEHPQQTLDECYRITQDNGGLIIVVPGERGFAADDDHKRFYDAEALRHLDPRWYLRRLFALPTVVMSPRWSRRVRQYSLVAVYTKTR